MPASVLLRKIRRGRTHAVKLAAASVAVSAGAAMVLGPAPEARAISVQQQVLTAGPLLELLPLLGIDTIPDIPLGSLDLGGISVPLFLTANFTSVPYDSQSIYNTINAMPFQRRLALIGTPPNDRVIRLIGATAGQYPAYLSSGIGTFNTIKAWRDQISSVDGTTPNGYTPFQPGEPSNATNEVFIFLRNPLRPNGGIVTRFAPLFNFLGVDTTLPAAGRISNEAGTIVLNTGTSDVAWAYDPLADFPVTLNPFSIVNSLLAGIPTNLIGGVSLQGLNQDGIPINFTDDLVLNLASVLGIINRESGGIISTISEGNAYYGTLVPNNLPILDPLRLPVRLINLVSSAMGMPLNLGTPIADALEPATKILVNIGYSDVIPPDKVDTCAAFCGTANARTYADLGYGAYDRSYLTSSTTQPFLSANPLTPQEWLQVPGDVVRALVDGFTGAITPKSAAAVSPAARTAAPAAAGATGQTQAAPAAGRLGVPGVSRAPRAVAPRQPARVSVSAATAKPIAAKSASAARR